MAEEGAADESQVTFNVKSSTDTKYVLTVPVSMTVLDLKNKLATSEYADIPAARQRLIYSGRVLKDPETVGSYKIKDGNTLHLVKGADSNARQNPADQGGAAAGAGPGNPSANVPQNIAAGTGTHNPLAGLTGARYAGFGQLPGMDMFGADGGMGAPPDPDQLLRLLEDPNFAQQMNEAMSNPAVLDMMRQNPMMRNNPMAQQVLNNPELRRVMFNPEFMRAQLNLQRQMGGMPGAGGAFPAPGNTDTTPSQTQEGNNASNQQGQDQNQQNPFAAFGGPNASGANPFAALFGGNPGAVQGNTPLATPPVGSTGQGTPAARSPTTENHQGQQNFPFGNLMNLMNPQGGPGGTDPLAEMTRAMAQNPEMMRSVMGMMNNMGGDMGAGQGGQGQGNNQQNPFGNLFNPYLLGGGFGGGQQQQPAQPADDRPPEERYAEQLRLLNEMGFYEFERNVRALRMSGGNVQGAVDMLLGGTL